MQLIILTKMTDAFVLIITLFIGVIAGFFDSTVGGGGLITIPSLIFLGLPPQVAIATDRLGTLGQEIVAIYKYWRAKKIQWRYVPALSFLSIIGALIGANFLLSIDPKSIQKIVAVLILILLIVIMVKARLGVKRIRVNKAKQTLGYFLYFFLQIFNGFFGTGAGPLSSYNHMFNFGFTMIQASATGIIPWLLLSLSSLVVFARGGVIDYQKGVVLLAGMSLGGYFGAHTALKKGNMWVKRLFSLVVVASAFKLLFF